jgi:hypothetical protein
VGDIGRADGIVVGGAKRPVELVELVVFDEESKPARARRNTEKLIEDGAVILFGPYGSAAGRAVASFGRVWGEGCIYSDTMIELHFLAVLLLPEVRETSWAASADGVAPVKA